MKKASTPQNETTPNNGANCATAQDFEPANRAYEELRRLRARGVIVAGPWAMASGPPLEKPTGGSKASIIKIERYNEGQSFTRILNDTLRDKRLGGLPLKVLCYALSMPRDWQLRSRQVRKELGHGERALCSAMKQLIEAGYARLDLVRDPRGRVIGRRWLIRESPKLPWPTENRVSRHSVTETAVAAVSVTETTVERASVNRSHNKDDTDEQRTSTSTSGSSPASDNPDSDSFLAKGHQHQKPVAVQDHVKWTEYAAWCASQRGKRYKDNNGKSRVSDGIPRAEGFRKWLARQPVYWQNRVKPKLESDGYLLDGQFLTTDQANRRAKADHTLIVKFRRAVRRHDGSVIVKEKDSNNGAES